MPWISPLLFLSSRMYRKFSKYQEPACGQDLLRCQGHAAIPSTNQPYGTMDGGGCSPRSYVSACFFIARSPYLLFQNNPADAVPVVLQSQALLIATVQKQLKINRFSFLLWRLTRQIRVQRRVRQFHVFVIPTFSQPYCVLTSDPFGFLLYSSPRSSARFRVVASRQYDKDHDRIQQRPGTWHLRQVGALCIVAHRASFH